MMTIGRTAKLAGISVRTLHYYDSVGLLHPQVGESGYRQYGEQELKRLWQILFFRELGFPLQQIKALLTATNADEREALRAQRALLMEKQERLAKIIADIDRNLTKGFEPNMLKTFDSSALEKHKQEYEQEAAERYGETYKQAKARTAAYSEDDWSQAMAQAQEIFDGLADCMPNGPDAPETLALVGKWRAYISERYYECTPEILKGLGELYVADERFTRNIDKTKPGLAAFFKQAIDAYCETLRG